MLGYTRPVKKKRTIDFNVPKDVIQRIKDRQVAHQGRMDRALDEQTMSAGVRGRANENALMTTERISAPDYQPSIRRDKQRDEMEQIGATSRGWIDNTRERSKGVMAANEQEFGFAKEAQGLTGNVMTPATLETPTDTSGMDIRNLMGADTWGGSGKELGPTSEELTGVGPFIKEQNATVKTGADRDFLPGGGTKFGKYFGPDYLQELIRKRGKQIKRFAVDPAKTVWNWGTSRSE